MFDAVAAFMEDMTVAAEQLAAREPSPMLLEKARYHRSCCRTEHRTMLVKVTKPPPRDPFLRDRAGWKCMECGLYDGKHDKVCTIGQRERDSAYL
jgi:hypothetical protein